MLIVQLQVSSLPYIHMYFTVSCLFTVSCDRDPAVHVPVLKQSYRELLTINLKCSQSILNQAHFS